MRRTESVDRLMSIFDLPNCVNFQLPENVSARVMFTYDRNKNIKEFKILNRSLPEELAGRIRSWLEVNHELCKTLAL
jgi:hypothetical protein